MAPLISGFAVTRSEPRIERELFRAPTQTAAGEIAGQPVTVDAKPG